MNIKDKPEDLGTPVIGHCQELLPGGVQQSVFCNLNKNSTNIVELAEELLLKLKFDDSLNNITALSPLLAELFFNASDEDKTRIFLSDKMNEAGITALCYYVHVNSSLLADNDLYFFIDILTEEEYKRKGIAKMAWFLEIFLSRSNIRSLGILKKIIDNSDIKDNLENIETVFSIIMKIAPFDGLIIYFDMLGAHNNGGFNPKNLHSRIKHYLYSENKNICMSPDEEIYKRMKDFIAENTFLAIEDYKPDLMLMTKNGTRLDKKTFLFLLRNNLTFSDGAKYTIMKNILEKDSNEIYTYLGSVSYLLIYTYLNDFIEALQNLFDSKVAVKIPFFTQHFKFLSNSWSKTKQRYIKYVFSQFGIDMDNPNNSN